MAIDVWITLIGDDRCDVETCSLPLLKLQKEAGLSSTELANDDGSFPVSPQHAYSTASILEGMLVCLDIPAKDVAKLLEPLNECCEQLGRSVGDPLKQKLMQIKSGAAKATAKALCERQNSLTDSRQMAITSALSARIDRALACVC